MGFAVVFIGSLGIELHAEGVTLVSDLVIHGDLFLVNTLRDGFFIEDNIVRSGLIENPVTRKGTVA